MMNWVQDVVFAYVAGIVAGAPFGLAAFWLTSRPEALTAALACAMTGLLLARRVRRRRFAAEATTA
jgi:hypothetical protein